MSQISNVLDDLPPSNIYRDIRFDAQGNYRGVYVCNHHLAPANMHVDTPSFRIPQEELEDYVDECINACCRVIVTRLDWKVHPPDPEHLRPYLCWQPHDVV